MKAYLRTVVLVLFFSFLSLSGWSQTIQAWGLKIGINAANETWNFRKPVRLSNFTAIDLGNYSWHYKTGYNFSAFVDIPMQRIVFSPQISFTRKGYYENKDIDIRDDNNSDLGRVHVHDVNLNYMALDLPLLFFPGKEKRGIYFLAGPSFNYFVSGSTRYHPLSLSSDYPNIFMVDFNKFRKLGIGLTLGMGTEFQLTAKGGRRLRIEGRYNSDCTDAYKNDNISIRNHFFSLSLAYVFFRKTDQ